MGLVLWTAWHPSSYCFSAAQVSIQSTTLCAPQGLMAAGLGAGLLAGGLTTPPDVIKTRMQADTTGRYKGLFVRTACPVVVYCLWQALYCLHSSIVCCPKRCLYCACRYLHKSIKLPLHGPAHAACEPSPRHAPVSLNLHQFCCISASCQRKAPAAGYQ